MYCQNCAREIDANAEICSGCGAPVAREKAASADFGNRAKAASQNALNAFKVFAMNPVGGLPAAFQSLDRRRAKEVGIVFSVVFALCVVIGTYMALPAWGKPGLKGIFGLLIVGSIPPAGIIGASAVARKVFSAAGSLEGDVFMAGASLLPVGFVALLAGILGVGNIEVLAVLAAFAGCYMVLMLYTGCTQISKIADARAAATVPVMLLLSAWLCKVVFVAML
jgi:hypothetical protein